MNTHSAVPAWMMPCSEGVVGVTDPGGNPLAGSVTNTPTTTSNSPWSPTKIGAKVPEGPPWSLRQRPTAQSMFRTPHSVKLAIWTKPDCASESRLMRSTRTSKPGTVRIWTSSARMNSGPETAPQSSSTRVTDDVLACISLSPLLLCCGGSGAGLIVALLQAFVVPPEAQSLARCIHHRAYTPSRTL